jgi:hypothetical protein
VEYIDSGGTLEQCVLLSMAVLQSVDDALSNMKPRPRVFLIVGRWQMSVKQSEYGTANYAERFTKTIGIFSMRLQHLKIKFGLA